MARSRKEKEIKNLKTLDQIEARLAVLASRHRVRYKAAMEDQKERERLEELRWEVRRRESLEPLLGVAGGVRQAVVNPGGKVPGDRLGTLVKINRTRVLVDFGEGYGEWSYPILDIRPATETQGTLIPFRLRRR